MVIGAKTHVKYSGIACHLIIKKRSFLAIIGKPIKLSFRVSNIVLWAKKQEKRPILNVGIIPYDNIWHASYVRRYLFLNVLRCMRFV